jgi:hypothetical protein
MPSVIDVPSSSPDKEPAIFVYALIGIGFFLLMLLIRKLYTRFCHSSQQQQYGGFRDNNRGFSMQSMGVRTADRQSSFDQSFNPIFSIEGDDEDPYFG